MFVNFSISYVKVHRFVCKDLHLCLQTTIVVQGEHLCWIAFRYDLDPFNMTAFSFVVSCCQINLVKLMLILVLCLNAIPFGSCTGMTIHDDGWRWVECEGKESFQNIAQADKVHCWCVFCLTGLWNIIENGSEQEHIFWGSWSLH
jgi:hypothetical protein